jgi:hypothetical protein
VPANGTHDTKEPGPSPVSHTGGSEAREGSCQSRASLVELLKPLRVAAVASDRLKRAGAEDTVWLVYTYRKHHPVLQYLPTKLAERIGENMQKELGFPDRADPCKWSET